MRTILLSGLPADAAAETVCALLRALPQPSSVMISRGARFSSACLRFDSHGEAVEALNILEGRCTGGVTARMTLPVEADLETA